MKSLLFVFLDGVGVGKTDDRVNPFVAAPTPFLESLLGGPLDLALPARWEAGLLYRSLDATLGWPGLPQSATGQTALLTGVNAAELMERHYGPWPGPTLKRTLDAGNLFSDGVSLGGARLANAYPPGYFRALEGGRMRASVPVYAALAAGLALSTLAAYRRGEGVPADLTGEHFVALESGLTPLAPEEAGARLVHLASGTPFTFFDFWLSDRAGHRSGLGEATVLVRRLDRFLEGVVTSARHGGELTVVITSDHGNLEEIGNRRHSFAPVPLVVVGPGAQRFVGAQSLLDVAPAIRSWWASGAEHDGRPLPGD